MYRYLNKVSIVMPVYNGLRWMEEAVASVQAQSFNDWELLISDDGSTDGSLQLAQRLASADSRIRVLTGARRGGSARARNRALNAASWPVVAFLDADDLWKPEFLRSQTEFMRQTQAPVVCSAYEMISEGGEVCTSPIVPQKRITTADMRRYNHIGLLTALVDMNRVGPLEFNVSMGSLRDDYAFMYRAVENGGFAAGNPECLACYRLNPGSVTASKYRLVPVQYRFYRHFLGQSHPRASLHTAAWALRGIRNFILR